MSKTIHISSSGQFDKILQTSRIVVVDFFAEWCGPCKMVAPIYEQLSAHLSIPDQITFVKVDVDAQKDISTRYGITVMPTFMVFKESQVIEMATGANLQKIQTAVQNIVNETKTATGGSSGSSRGQSWSTAEVPRGYKDVTDQVDMNGLDLLNADSNFGRVQILFGNDKPTGLEKKSVDSKTSSKDWVQSDTDEQLMLYIPFQSTLKTHSLQITSLSDTDHGDVPMRPKTIQIYPNRAQILGFEEAENYPPTQTVTLTEADWDETGTAIISLRYVKFQNVTSLVLFIVDGDGDGEHTRIDRIRIIGERGEKRDPGKLEKLEE